MRVRSAVLAVLLSQVLARAGLAQGATSGLDLVPGSPRGSQACTVIAVDSVTMNFLCRTNRDIRQYWIARSTRFFGSGPNGSFFDLSTGQSVQVTFHNAGRLSIADSVSF